MQLGPHKSMSQGVYCTKFRIQNDHRGHLHIHLCRHVVRDVGNFIDDFSIANLQS